MISNDSKGLYQYLTASNIRNKIRNPLFIYYKFHLCVSLSYNLDLIADPAVSLHLP